MKYLTLTLLALPLLVSCEEVQEVYYTPRATHVHPSVRMAEPTVQRHVEISPRPAPRSNVHSHDDTRRPVVIAVPQAQPNVHGHEERPSASVERSRGAVVITNQASQTPANVHGHDDKPVAANRVHSGSATVSTGFATQDESNVHGHH